MTQTHSPTAKPDDSTVPRSGIDEVDLTLIREMLALSPRERLQHLEDHAAFIQELRDANPALRVQTNP